MAGQNHGRLSGSFSKFVVQFEYDAAELINSMSATKIEWTKTSDGWTELAPIILANLRKNGEVVTEVFVVNSVTGAVAGTVETSEKGWLSIAIAPYRSLTQQDLLDPTVQFRYLARMKELLYRAVRADTPEGLELRFTIAQIGAAAHARDVPIKDRELPALARADLQNTSPVKITLLPPLLLKESPTGIALDFEADEVAESISRQLLNSPHRSRLTRCMPVSKDVVHSLTDILRKIILPETSDELWSADIDVTKLRIAQFSKNLAQQLVPQVDRAFAWVASETGKSVPLSQSRLAVNHLFHHLPSIRSAVLEDIQLFNELDPAAVDWHEVAMAYPGIQALMVHRVASCLYNVGVPEIPRLMAEYEHSERGIDIHPGATISPEVMIDHGTEVVIGQTAKIGRRCRIHQGCTLGAWKFEYDENHHVIKGTQRHPTLEARVTVYANATILGGGTVIGHDSDVGASTLVTESMPPESIAFYFKGETRFKAKPQHKKAG